MQYYFAPMEGITGYVFRGAHHRHYGGVDQYYTPFITPTQTRKLTARELEDVRPEHNQGIAVVPQILTNHEEDFLWAAGRLAEMGYREVNLNLGCPSPTVVTKHRGSGFLELTGKLDRFLETVSRGLEEQNMKFSVKTRIGLLDPDEFPELLRIYNQYPLERLIVHPRVRTDFYKNHPNLDSFRLAAENSKNPVCYNGDLFSAEDAAAFWEQFPETDALMMGRGMLTNPALAEEIRAAERGKPSEASARAERCEMAGGRRQRLLAFHDEVLEGYRQVIPGDKNVMFKMKELWSYLAFSFPNEGKLIKKIKKAQRMEDYRAAVKGIFETGEMAEPPMFGGF